MLPHDTRKLLDDIQYATEMVQDITRSLGFADYQAQATTRLAVERLLITIGEAIGQLVRLNPELADRITECHRIVNLRHRLVHGYSDISHDLIWDVVETRLDRLLAEVRHLLANSP